MIWKYPVKYKPEIYINDFDYSLINPLEEKENP